MTVVYRNENQTNTFTAGRLLNFDQILVTALVRQLLIDGTESAIEQVLDRQADMDGQDLQRSSIQDYLREVPENAEVFIEDVLHDLLSTVKHNIRTALYGAAVTGIKYDLAGNVTDVEVDVTVNW